MRIIKLVSVITAALIGAATFTPSAFAAAGVRSDQESQMVGQVNGHRSGMGLGTLSVHAGLLDVARRQSTRMANEGRIYHNPNLSQDVSAVLPGWKIVGENVGTGMSAEAVEQLFLGSAPHRANIENPNYTLIAVGAVESADGMLYFTQVFAQPGTPRTSSNPAPAPAAKAPAPAPAAPPAAKPAAVRPAATTRATPSATAKAEPVATPVPTAEPAVQSDAKAPEAEPEVTTVRGSFHSAPSNPMQRVVSSLKSVVEALFSLFSQSAMVR